MAGDQSTGWRATLLGALFVVFMAVVGWVATDAQTARTQAQQQLDAQAKQLSDQAQRIAIVEEALRGVTRTLDRIEDGVNELRRERRAR